jgi:hypothetical protein
MIVAKLLEAVGIATVMIGLVQGIMSDNMWIELYLSIGGVVVFLCGWGVERFLSRTRGKPPSP